MLYRQPVVTETHGEGAEWTKNKLTADAPIWRVYHEFAQNYDEGMLRDWSSSIDTMLIFAGIFAATTTAFIIEAYKQMEPDYTQLLFLALTARDNTSSAMLAANFVAPTSARVVNRLWIGSLIVSLFAALVAILAKQWLCAYSVQNRGDFREWAQLRQFRFECLGRWHVPEIIACLPLLLHISLLLFLTGLVVFMAPIDYGTMILALVAFVLGFVVYLGSMLSPLLWSGSPYRTQLTPLVGRIVAFILRKIPALRGQLRDTLQNLPNSRVPPLSRAAYGKASPPSPEDPWHVVANPNDPQSLALPLEWLTMTSSSKQILSELVDAFGDIGLGRDSLNALPQVVHLNLAAVVSELIPEYMPHDRRLRVLNTAASLAIPMNVDRGIETMCLAICNRHKHATANSNAKGTATGAIHDQPVIDAVSNARLWLSLHSDFHLETISAAWLISSPLKFGLPASTGLAMLDRVEACPPCSTASPHPCAELGRECGITRMSRILLIWREVFVTAEAVDCVIARLRRVLGEGYSARLLNWKSDDPCQRLAFALAAAVDSDCWAHASLRSSLTPLFEHLLWLLGIRGNPYPGIGHDVDVTRLISADASSVVDRGNLTQHAYAYPALVALGELKPRVRAEYPGSRLITPGPPQPVVVPTHAPSNIAKPFCPILCSALEVYNPTQLRACVDLIRRSSFFTNLARLEDDTDDERLPVLALLGTCVLRLRDREYVDWFSQHLLDHRRRDNSSRPATGNAWDSTGSKQPPSILAEVLWGLRETAAAPSDDPSNRRYPPGLGILLASIYSLVLRNHTSGSSDLRRLAEDVHHGLVSQTIVRVEPRKPSNLWDTAREAIKRHSLRIQQCGEMDTGIEDEQGVEEHANAIYALAHFYPFGIPKHPPLSRSGTEVVGWPAVAAETDRSESGEPASDDANSRTGVRFSLPGRPVNEGPPSSSGGPADAPLQNDGGVTNSSRAARGRTAHVSIDMETCNFPTSSSCGSRREIELA